jgi:hypothetical protein
MAKKILPQRDDSRKDIDSMTYAELLAYNDELSARITKILAERGEDQPDLRTMTADERKQYITELRNCRSNLRDVYAMSDDERRQYQDELLARLQAYVSPEPEPVKDAKLPTKRMAKRMAAFDAMNDAEQVDSLRAMW